MREAEDEGEAEDEEEAKGKVEREIVEDVLAKAGIVGVIEVVVGSVVGIEVEAVAEIVAGIVVENGVVSIVGVVLDLETGLEIGEIGSRPRKARVVDVERDGTHHQMLTLLQHRFLLEA